MKLTFFFCGLSHVYLFCFRSLIHTYSHRYIYIISITQTVDYLWSVQYTQMSRLGSGSLLLLLLLCSSRCCLYSIRHYTHSPLSSLAIIPPSSEKSIDDLTFAPMEGRTIESIVARKPRHKAASKSTTLILLTPIHTKEYIHRERERDSKNGNINRKD